MTNWLLNNTVEVIYWFLVWNLLHFSYIKIKDRIERAAKNDSGET